MLVSLLTCCEIDRSADAGHRNSRSYAELIQGSLKDRYASLWAFAHKPVAKRIALWLSCLLKRLMMLNSNTFTDIFGNYPEIPYIQDQRGEVLNQGNTRGEVTKRAFYPFLLLTAMHGGEVQPGTRG